MAGDWANPIDARWHLRKAEERGAAHLDEGILALEQQAYERASTDLTQAVEAFEEALAIATEHGTREARERVAAQHRQALTLLGEVPDDLDSEQSATVLRAAELFDAAEAAARESREDEAIHLYQRAATRYEEYLERTRAPSGTERADRSAVERRLTVIEATIEELETALAEKRKRAEVIDPDDELDEVVTGVPAAPPAELCLALVSLAQALGRLPTPEDVEEEGTHDPREYVQTFGSWREALDAAGLL